MHKKLIRHNAGSWAKKREGGDVKFYPYEKGGGRKEFKPCQRGGAQKVLG